MAGALMGRFLREDASPEVRELLLAAIEGWRQGMHQERQEFEFANVDVLFDFAAGRVTVDDDLDTSDAGEESCRIEEFEALLRSDQP